MSGASWPSWPVQTWGDRSRPALVLLHGFMGTARDWDAALPALSPRFWCVAPELPGHGRRRLGGPLEMGAWAGALAATIRAQGLSRAHLMGYSMGGRLALRAAIEAPEVVDRLVLEGTSAGIEGSAERLARAAQDDALAALIRVEGLEVFLRRWYGAPLFESLGREPGRLEAVIAARADQDPESMARIIAGMSPGRQRSEWDRLGGVRCPTLIVAGELDEKYRGLGARMVGLMGSARQAIVEGAGHNAHLERPGAFVDRVVEFLES